MSEEHEYVDTAPVSTSPTARVADSYGVNPHEHKPSQDPWEADTADDKQAETGGVQVAPGEALADEEEPSPGSSYSDSQSSDASTESTKPKSDFKPAQSAENPSTPAPKGSSTARSTATNQRTK